MSTQGCFDVVADKHCVTFWCDRGVACARLGLGGEGHIVASARRREDASSCTDISVRRP
jgi:hypothetical protein